MTLTFTNFSCLDLTLKTNKQTNKQTKSKQKKIIFFSLDLLCNVKSYELQSCLSQCEKSYNGGSSGINHKWFRCMLCTNYFEFPLTGQSSKAALWKKKVISYKSLFLI